MQPPNRCGEVRAIADTGPKELKKTPLFDLHVEQGGKMVPFSGYQMPVHYPTGILCEHKHTRSATSVFDVSHMGQIALRGDNPAKALENLVPGDISGLAKGRMRYTQFTDDTGGILDDLIVTNVGDYLFLVVNATRKDADVAHLKTCLPGGTEVEVLNDRALIALQGPAAAIVLSKHAPGSENMPFMTALPFEIDGSPVAVTRSGYTGEDGYEISIPSEDAVRITELILSEDGVQPAGLGARDSLRLEAGLCLYGHDIDETITPVEAELTWSIAKRRRLEGGFPGAEVIQRQIARGAERKRVGILPDGRAPAREGTDIIGADGEVVGMVTSGGFGPSFGGPIAMGYVKSLHAAKDTRVNLMIRDKPRPGCIVGTTFVPNRYFRS